MCHVLRRERSRRDRVITCCIEYTLHPRKLAWFEEYATSWPPIIERCGGDLVDYYLPKEGRITCPRAH